MVNKFLWILIFGVALTGCARDMSDLETYTQNIKQRNPGAVKPIPQFKQYESYYYIAERSPFIALDATERQLGQQEAQIDETLKPDGDRRKEALEFYPLDSLTMVGSVEQKRVIWALVKDPESAIHKVRIGNHIGQNYGEVMSITESNIVLNEVIQDTNGSWVERVSKLQVAVEE